MSSQSVREAGFSSTVSTMALLASITWRPFARRWKRPERKKEKSFKRIPGLERPRDGLITATVGLRSHFGSSSGSLALAQHVAVTPCGGRCPPGPSPPARGNPQPRGRPGRRHHQHKLLGRRRPGRRHGQRKLLGLRRPDRSQLSASYLLELLAASVAVAPSPRFRRSRLLGGSRRMLTRTTASKRARRKNSRTAKRARRRRGQQVQVAARQLRALLLAARPRPAVRQPVPWRPHRRARSASDFGPRTLAPGSF